MFCSQNFIFSHSSSEDTAAYRSPTTWCKNMQSFQLVCCIVCICLQNYTEKCFISNANKSSQIKNYMLWSVKCDEEGERVFPAVIRDDRRHDPDTGAAGAGTTHQYESKVSDEMLLRGPGLSSLFIFGKISNLYKIHSCCSRSRGLFLSSQWEISGPGWHFTGGYWPAFYLWQHLL